MKTWLASVLILAVVIIVISGLSCGHKRDGCRIYGTVINADTGAPVDSASVYVTHLEIPASSVDRRFICLTDEDGKFWMWANCDAIHIVDIEKEGYLGARQVVHGGGDLLFALETVTAVSDGSKGASSLTSQEFSGQRAV